MEDTKTKEIKEQESNSSSKKESKVLTFSERLIRLRLNGSKEKNYLFPDS